MGTTRQPFTGLFCLCAACILLYMSKRNKTIKSNIRSESKLGSKNPMWKDNCSYKTLHEWVRRNFVIPGNCEICGKHKNSLDAANKGIYNRDRGNWEFICRRCHMQKDGRLSRLSNKETAKKAFYEERRCGFSGCEVLFTPSPRRGKIFCSKQCSIKYRVLTIHAHTK